MARLNTTIHVYDGADVIVYGPGDEVLPQHREQITAPGVWEDEPETNEESSAESTPATAETQPAQESAPEQPETPDESTAEAGEPDSSGDAAVEIPVPPKGGAGSGKQAWNDYAVKSLAARGLKIDIPDDASREDIVAALNSAGIPTE